MKDLTERLLLSTVILSFVLTAVYFSHTPFFKPIFILLFAAVIGMALFEYYRLAKIKGLQPLSMLGLGASTLYVIAIHSPLASLPGFILFGTLMASLGSYFKKATSPLVNSAVTLFGILYITLPLTCLSQINYLPNGSAWLLYLLLVVKCTDAGGYFSGKWWGSHKLCPAISPGKTWEGAVVGTLCGMGASALMGIEVLSLHLGEALALGFLLSVVGQFGDLAESLLKRDVKVKDSNTVPGLGGVLDILDSLIFTSPLLYLYLLERL